MIEEAEIHYKDLAKSDQISSLILDLFVSFKNRLVAEINYWSPQDLPNSENPFNLKFHLRGAFSAWVLKIAKRPSESKTAANKAEFAALRDVFDKLRMKHILFNYFDLEFPWSLDAT